jgi:hypothetical protein
MLAKSNVRSQKDGAGYLLRFEAGAGQRYRLTN